MNLYTSTEHFNSDRPLTLGEQLYPAMRITDQEDAANYLAAYVGYLEAGGFDPVEALKVALGNIGYFAVSCSPETYRRVQRLFGALHPLLLGDAQ